ncbi:MAG: SMC-Scp complex subunit ScpB [Butyricicoccus sp.]|nr:SMC-Scp complex subunit ScpB [Butyricicoccus sp.]
MNPLQATLEAILFAAGDAIPIVRLAQATGAAPDDVEAALDALADQYDFEQRGIMLVRMEDKAQLCSRPAYADAVRRAVESRKPPQLSPAALKVLTIVAYRQPVTRAYIEQLRGVDSGGTVASLTEKGLIAEAGRLDVPGRPILFRTTDVFLRTFSLSSLSELPELPELTEGEQLQLSMDNQQTG